MSSRLFKKEVTVANQEQRRSFGRGKVNHTTESCTKRFAWSDRCHRLDSLFSKGHIPVHLCCLLFEKLIKKWTTRLTLLQDRFCINLDYHKKDSVSFFIYIS